MASRLIVTRVSEVWPAEIFRNSIDGGCEPVMIRAEGMNEAQSSLDTLEPLRNFVFPTCDIIQGHNSGLLSLAPRTSTSLSTLSSVEEGWLQTKGVAALISESL